MRQLKYVVLAAVAVAACGRTGLLIDDLSGVDGDGRPHGHGNGTDDGGLSPDAADAGLDALDPNGDPLEVSIGDKHVPNVQQIVAGEAHACLRDKKSRVFCWGVNDDGQLGNGTTDLSFTAIRVEGLPEIVRLAAGQRHTCALGADQSVWCWGSDGDGELGNGIRQPSFTRPLKVEGILTKSVAITAGGWHTCVLDAVGQMTCWGRNTSGECGAKGADRFTTPNVVEAMPRGVKAMTSGTWHTCAVMADSTVKCFGRNADGQLGIGSAGQFESTPMDVRFLSDVAFLMAGDDHTCAIQTGGGMMCWGDGFLGELGNGIGQGNPTPTPVPDAFGALHAAGGLEHTCAVMGDHSVQCWGKGLQGQLGNKDTPLLSKVPVPVEGIHDAVQVAAGSEFSCIAHAVRGASCWGASGNGELGHGPNDDEFQTTPVDVIGLD
jgi:alpha-tubulin suppressor-like RCC1 family protein